MKQVFLIFVFLVFSIFVQAQVAGTTTFISENFSYQENMTNVELDPSPMIGPASEVSFIRTFATNQQPGIGLGDAIDLIGVGGVSIPGWLEDLAGGWNPFCFDFDPYIELGASIDAGGYYLVREVGNSDIDIDYPVEVTITYPEQNTFGCGWEIRIDTQYEVLEPNKMDKLKVTPPFINQEIGPKLQNLEFFAGIGVSAWYGIGIDNPFPGPDLCEEVASFNESVRFEVGGPALPTLPAILNLCEEAYGPGANEASLLSCGVLSPVTPLLNLGQTALDIYNAENGTNYTFADFPNENQVDVFTPDFSGGPTLPEMGGTFKKVKNNDLNFQALNGGKTLRVYGTKNAISEMSVDLISFIDYSGYPTSLSLGGGLGSLDLGDLAPTFTVNQEMNFEFNPIINLNLDLGQSMVYSVYNSDDTLSHNGTGQIVALVAGQYILADFPYDLSDPLEVTGETYLDGTFETLSTQKYYQSINIKFAEVDIPGVFTGALIDENTPNPKEKFGENTILDHSFNLEPENVIALQGFTLDPEDPIVTISSLTVEDLINLGGGERAVVYKIGVRNDGDVKLNNTRVHFDLNTWFATATSYNVECITSDYFVVDNDFNGSSINNLLDINNSIGIGEEHFIEILVRVKPEISEIIANGCFDTVEYYVSTTAFATSPIGTEVESNYNQCTEMTIAADIVETVDMGASIISGLQDFTVYSTKTLTFIKGQQVSKGNAGSKGKVKFENVSMQNNPPAVIVGDMHSGDLINVIGHSDVVVDYVQTSSEINLIGNHSNFDVTGRISDYSNCATLPDIPTFILPNNNSKMKIIVGNNETLVLAPGNYKEIKLNRNSVLIMQSGTYNIKDWHFIKNNATVEFDLNGSPIVINIQNWHAGKNNLQFITTGDSSTRDVFYNVDGNGTTTFNGSLVQGNIIAPLGTVTFNNESTLEGNCYAETIKFKNGSGYAGHKYLEPLNISAECQDVVVYRVSVQQPIVFKDNGSMDEENDSFKNLNLIAYPNPMFDHTTIYFNLDFRQDVRLILQDIRGNTIQTITDKSFNSGYNEVHVNTSSLKQGLYFYSFVSDQGIVTKKLLKR